MIVDRLGMCGYPLELETTVSYMYILFHINTLVDAFVFVVACDMIPRVCKMSIEPWYFDVHSVQLFFCCVPLFGIVQIVECDFKIVGACGHDGACDACVSVVEV